MRCQNRWLAMVLCALAAGVLIGLIFPTIVIVWLLAVVGILAGVIFMQC